LYYFFTRPAWAGFRHCSTRPLLKHDSYKAQYLGLKIRVSFQGKKLRVKMMIKLRVMIQGQNLSLKLGYNSNTILQKTVEIVL
jgi:hypothetical protein